MVSDGELYINQPGTSGLVSSFPADKPRIDLWSRDRALKDRFAPTPHTRPAPAPISGRRRPFGRLRLFTAFMASTSTVNGSESISPTAEPNAPQKRKSEEGVPQPRAKRNRYISIAWWVKLRCLRQDILTPSKQRVQKKKD